MQISYNLIKLDNALAFQVSKQSRALTRFLQDIEVFIASNGWKIKSNNFPGINMPTGTIFLRGDNDTLDTYVSTVIGLKTKTRDKIASQIYSAIQEFLRFAIESAELDQEKENDIIMPRYSTNDFKAVKSNVRRYSL